MPAHPHPDMRNYSLQTKDSTAVNGAFSGTFMVLYGSFGSEVSVILNCTWVKRHGWDSERQRPSYLREGARSIVAFGPTLPSVVMLSSRYSQSRPRLPVGVTQHHTHAAHTPSALPVTDRGSRAIGTCMQPSVKLDGACFDLNTCPALPVWL